MKHTLSLFLAVVICLAHFPALGGENTLRLHFSQDRLWIHAREASLWDILEAFAKRGVEVRVDPTINPLISVSFSNEDLSYGLGRILRGHNWALAWENISGPLGPVTRLKEILVFEPGAEGRMQAISANRSFVVEKGPDGLARIKDEVLVRFSPDAPPQRVKELLDSLGASIVAAHNATGVYRLVLPENSDIDRILRELAQNGLVAGAEPNHAYSMAPALLLAQGRGQVQSNSGNARLHEGAASVAIFDSGLSSLSGLGDLVAGSLNALEPSGAMDDTLGHGTQMALIASGRILPAGAKEGMALENPVIPIRVFDDNGMTSNFTIFEAIDYAKASGARVINLSWGSSADSGFLADALLDAHKAGIVLVAAAGNEPTGQPVYPAAYPTVIAVAARNPQGQTWENSNMADFVALIAPGFAQIPPGLGAKDGLYAGTSIASAFVSGVIAHILTQNPQAGTEQIWRSIAESF
ncbi:MAG: S8 family serine peptidase [Desulfatibacillaceae bacterium]|nr:S8 family serine peptidase [Desulfatibacillaceae bacterium]